MPALRVPPEKHLSFRCISKNRHCHCLPVLVFIQSELSSHGFRETTIIIIRVPSWDSSRHFRMVILLTMKVKVVIGLPGHRIGRIEDWIGQHVRCLNSTAAPVCAMVQWCPTAASLAMGSFSYVIPWRACFFRLYISGTPVRPSLWVLATMRCLIPLFPSLFGPRSPWSLSIRVPRKLTLPVHTKECEILTSKQLWYASTTPKNEEFPVKRIGGTWWFVHDQANSDLWLWTAIKCRKIHTWAKFVDTENHISWCRAQSHGTVPQNFPVGYFNFLWKFL